jgi:hypothetical protein
MSYFLPASQVCLLNQVLSVCPRPEFKIMSKKRLEFLYHDLSHYVGMRENIDALNSNIPVPEPLLFSVISSCQGGTHEMSDNIGVYGKDAALLKSRDS